MNEFIEQFLIEARDLVDQATADLLALEEDPNHAEHLDSAFRAFHTLKGAAGIVDFDAMARALHAVEDGLATVRAGRAHLSAKLVGDCLSALDQVLVWLDAMEAAGAPPTGADPAADVIIARFSSQVVTVGPPSESADDWQAALLAKFPNQVDLARTALRYTPNAQAFFDGQDPLAVLAGAPGLIAVDIQPAGPWPALSDFDPFACQVVLTALSTASTDELSAAFDAHGQGVDIVTLAPRSATFEARASALIEAQIALLGDRTPEGFAGRLASAGQTAAGVLRFAGRAAEDIAVRSALGDPTGGDLIAALERVLRGEATLVPEKAAGTPSAPPDATARALRVDVERIDALVRLSGELLVAKNALGHLSALAQNGADPAVLAQRLKEQHGILDQLVAELQRSVVSIRVLPLRHVFQRFPRLVREMGVTVGKPARLVSEGDDTEADKTVVEALFEPLLHVLRNAVDHGLESPADRAGLGKPEVATLQLRAARRGEHVVVEVEDDGRGVDVERVRQVALQRGVRSAEALAEMAEADIADLIFAPGFSTATEVTDLSGRGVGMDVVRVGVERLGGQVALDSRPGQGTIVRFTLPFTVMMTSLMTVQAAGQVFGIPLDTIVETVRAPRDHIQPIGSARAFVHRDRTIPVFDLAGALGNPEAIASSLEATIVVTSAGGQLTGLEVDQVGERLDVMLKPMDGILGGAVGIAGTTLLGDGRVLIVLDLQDLLQ